MKRLMSLLAGALLVIGLVTLAYADEMLRGRVVSIDSAGKTVVIDTPAGSRTVLLHDTTKGVEGVQPGMSVEMTCFDVEGKSCARDIKVISVEEAGRHIGSVEGEVVSIDPEGKAIVIKPAKGKEVTISIKEPPAVERVTVKEGAPAGEEMAVEPAKLSEVKPGEKVRIDCFDSGSKFCASRVTVVPFGGAPGLEVVGNVVSIDPEGRAVVVKTPAGERTLYYQKSTTGTALDEVQVGKNVRAYCLDIEGKSCIKDINLAE